MGPFSYTKKMYGNIVPTPLQRWSCDKYNMQRQLVGI